MENPLVVEMSERDERPYFIYALHSGKLYGTERMALATLEQLRDRFRPVVFAPAGDAIGEAEKRGMQAYACANKFDLLKGLRPFFANNDSLAFAATGLVHSATGLALQKLYGTRVGHLHMVHGGTDEKRSYGRKHLLNRFPVTFVAVSDFVCRRLQAHGVERSKIRTIENFLLDQEIHNNPQRQRFAGKPINEILIVSRIDPIKRIDLLFAAIDSFAPLRQLRFRIAGSGSQFSAMRQLAEQKYPNVEFTGFCDDIPALAARSDLLLHLCPEEPFGLVVLEAMAARLPVLVPDEGGAAALVRDGKTGFRFRADDASDLAHKLWSLHQTSSNTFNPIVHCAHKTLVRHFSATTRIEDYHHLLSASLS